MERKIISMPWHSLNAIYEWSSDLIEVYEVHWCDVKPGDLVFIASNLVGGKPAGLYGRHKVVDPDKRILENANGRQFYERWETLFVEAK